MTVLAHPDVNRFAKKYEAQVRAEHPDYNDQAVHVEAVALAHNDKEYVALCRAADKVDSIRMREIAVVEYLKKQVPRVDEDALLTRERTRLMKDEGLDYDTAHAHAHVVVKMKKAAAQSSAITSSTATHAEQIKKAKRKAKKAARRLAGLLGTGDEAQAIFDANKKAIEEESSKAAAAGFEKREKRYLESPVGDNKGLVQPPVKTKATNTNTRTLTAKEHGDAISKLVKLKLSNARDRGDFNYDITQATIEAHSDLTAFILKSGTPTRVAPEVVEEEEEEEEIVYPSRSAVRQQMQKAGGQ